MVLQEVERNGRRNSKRKFSLYNAWSVRHSLYISNEDNGSEMNELGLEAIRYIGISVVLVVMLIGLFGGFQRK